MHTALELNRVEDRMDYTIKEKTTTHKRLRFPGTPPLFHSHYAVPCYDILTIETLFLTLIG